VEDAFGDSLWQAGDPHELPADRDEIRAVGHMSHAGTMTGHGQRSLSGGRVAMGEHAAETAVDLEDVRVSVSVDGRRWRRLRRPECLARAGASDRVFVLDPGSGTVRFGDGRHGARPPEGALVRACYRLDSGGAGNVVVTWAGIWPPRAFPIAAGITPGVVPEDTK
jgi:hypothetical protein